MVYTYQIVTKELTSRALPGEKCPVCNKETLEITLYMRYISAIIPIYGMGRRTGVHCTACNHEVKNPDASIFAKKKYAGSIDAAIRELRATHRRTWWQLLYPWSFWFVLLGIACCGMVASRIQKSRINHVKAMLANPQPGDVYKSTWDESGNGSKGLLVKVVRLNGDTMEIVRSQAGIENSYDSKAWNLLDEKVFDTHVYQLSLSSFKEGACYFEYPNAGNDNEITYLGCVLGRGTTQLDFNVIKREK
jgi:hypothetical protein